MTLIDRLGPILPGSVRRQLDAWGDATATLMAVDNPKVTRNMLPSAVRGLLLQRGRQGEPTRFPASHDAHFDWQYPSDQPEMAELYRRAKLGQWNGDTDLDWSVSVDPLDPAVPLIPVGFVNFEVLAEMGLRLDAGLQREMLASIAAWMLSQFLHGEQGALMAAAQCTEAVPTFDGKFYGATQVMDEARHVEVFHRYLATKLEKLYCINDNLFVIIDSLMTDSRWDMKFLGMQIMVEGLALGAFTTLYQLTTEPLLADLLRRVIQDEARHVHYGVIALRDHFTNELTDGERREREDWAFQLSLLMRDRFLAMEVYEEWASHKLTRAQWKHFIEASPGMEAFRCTMFSRMVPNLREIGLLSNRIRPAYERAGLARYFNGAAAPDLTAEAMLTTPIAA